MVFSSLQFLAFLVVVVLLLWVLPVRFHKSLLLAASYWLCASWDVRFALLLLASTIVDFLAGKGMHRSPGQARRTSLLRVSVLLNLGLLGFFKYYNFFADSARSVLSRWGLGVSNLDIILPVGISFYTFQKMSYTIDVFRERVEPIDRFADFALFVAFFPKLVAGPIVRTVAFAPQLRDPARVRATNVWAGSQIFIFGLFKKRMIADAVSPFVNAVYDYPEYYSSPTVWLAVMSCALQIYCDFSGYSDMAIGCARMLGFRLDRNFHMPYLSTNVTEFWRRWHISLSSWLRDYLYIPLGGNRKGRLRTSANLLITMVLGGLWHGASWNFVVWGAVHGLALVCHKWWSARFQSYRASILARIVSVASTFLFVTLAWVLFRAQDGRTALAVYSKLLFVDAGGAAWYYRAALAGVVWAVLGHVVGSLRPAEELVFFRTPYSFVAALAVSITLLIILVFAPMKGSPFIYFGF